MEIRKGTLKDLEAIAAVEAACFPAAEAATAEEFAGRLQQYGDHFWLLWEGERLLAFVDGFCTDWPDLTDEMYADASLHRENGAWQMIFGVNTIPACRRQGYAGQLLQQAIADARAQGRKGLVLTCKEALVHYYAKFGFVNEGVSGSTHGGRGVVPDAAEVLRGTIWNGLRLAPAVFSGRIIFKRAMPELPRTLRHCIFTGGGVKVDGICSAAFCESAALRQTFRLNCKVTGFARGSPFEERLPPLRGKMSP